MALALTEEHDEQEAGKYMLYTKHLGLHKTSGSRYKCLALYTSLLRSCTTDLELVHNGKG